MKFKKSISNTIVTNIISQFVAIGIALIIPKLIIENYGSEINGIVSSSRQIVQYCFLLDGGIAAAAGYSLYGFLKRRETNEINHVFSAVNKFYFKVGIIVGLVLLVFSFLYPLNIEDKLEYFKAVAIILLNSVIVIVGYLYFNKYNLILFSDEKQYIITSSIIISSFLSTVIQVIMIKENINIILVISINTLINILRLLFLMIFIKKKYSYLDKSVTPKYSYIDQKWEAIAINVSAAIKVIIPTIFISIFFGFTYVSIFTIYESILHVGSSILNTCSDGLTPTLGKFISTNGVEKSNRVFELSNIVTIVLTGIMSVCFYILIIPFIDIYMGANTEISYKFPLLALLLIINVAINNIRFAPNMLIKATGKLRETSKSAIVEVLIAMVLVPICCYIKFEYVIIGVILSSLYRTIYIFWFCYAKILNKKPTKFLKACIINIIISIVISKILSSIIYSTFSIKQFIIVSAIVLLVTSVIYICIATIMNYKEIKSMLLILKKDM